MSTLIVDEQFACWVGEYSSILNAATREGWLLPLLDAHWTPCDRDDAKRLLAWISVYRIEGGLPHSYDVRWSHKRGRARFNRQTRRYGISLPSTPGTNYAHLRAGLVLHEAAHVIDRMQSGTFGHKEKFRRILRRLVTSDWRRELKPAGTQREIYGRHAGPYSLLLARAAPGKGGKVTETTEHLAGPFNSEEAHEEARMLVGDPRENITSVHVFSISEGQFTGAFYRRGDTYLTWDEMRAKDLADTGFDNPWDKDAVKEQTDEGRLELPDQRDEAALLPGRPEPLREVGAPVERVVPKRTVPAARPVRRVPPQEQAAAGTQRKRGVTLELDPGNAERWPASKGASIVRAALDKGLRGTASELAKALAADLTAAGVEFPASLISRLKQGGFLREVQD